MGQNMTLCNGEERSLTKESTDLQLMNNDYLTMYTVKEIENIRSYILPQGKCWSFDTTKGHTATIYKNEITFFWHENYQPKLSFKIKALRRTATTPFSYFNPGSQVVKLEFPPSNDLEEKIFYRSMNYTDFKLKMKELKYQQQQQQELEEAENI